VPDGWALVVTTFSAEEAAPHAGLSIGARF
jgi:hypothetical protein